MIMSDIKAGVSDASSRYLLFQDNLDAQCKSRNPEYINYLKTDCQTDDHKLPPNKTDQVQPIDRGIGMAIKFHVGNLLDQWLEDDDNLNKWECNTFSASDRRILLAQWCALLPMYIPLHDHALPVHVVRVLLRHPCVPPLNAFLLSLLPTGIARLTRSSARRECASISSTRAHC